MSEVEAVAKAIYEADPSYDCGPWKDLMASDFAHSVCMQQARAAIAALSKHRGEERTDG